MSLNMIDMLTAIRVRLEASSNSTFRANRVYLHKAPPDVTPKVGQLPVVVVSGVSADADDTFSTDGVRISFTVSIMDHASNTDGPMNSAYTRVYGNAAPPNTAPTFGLHRHIPTMASGSNKPGIIVFESAQFAWEEDPTVIGWVLTFSVHHEEA